MKIKNSTAPFTPLTYTPSKGMPVYPPKNKLTAVSSVSNSSVIEGEKELFTVNLVNVSASSTAVTLNLTNGSASLGSDFTADFETSFDGGKKWSPLNEKCRVDVPGNVSSFLVRHSTVNDTNIEANETYTLTACAIGGSATGTGTIIDNDKRLTTIASITNSDVVEGEKEVFKVTLSNPGSDITTIQITPAGGTATPGDDFTPDLEVSYDNGANWSAINPDGTAAVPGNTSNFLVRHSTVDDNIVEPTEAYTLTVSANGTQVTGTGTIRDNDKATTVASITNSDVVEGSHAIFTVTLEHPGSEPTTVKLTPTGDTATLGSDFSPNLEVSFDNGTTWTFANPDGTVNVPGNTSTFLTRVETKDDNIVEPTEAYTLTVSANGTQVTGTGTIRDNDKAPIAPKVISVSDAKALEGDKEVFTVGLSDTTVAPTTIQLNLASGTATLGSDFSPNLEASFDGGKTWSGVPGNGQLSVGVGVKDFQVRTMALTDNIKELPETFKLSASANGGSANGTGVILDKTIKPISAQIVGTDCINEGAKATYCVTIDTVSDKDRLFTLQIDNGSAKRFDGNGSGQDFVWGGAYDIKSTGQVFQNRVPNSSRPSDGSRAAVGAGDASQDYTIYDSQGKLSTGNTVTVKVAAGETKSEQFTVKTWQEKVTVDRDYFNPNGLNKTNYYEGTENFSIKIVGGEDVQVKNSLNVAIKDTSHYNFVSPIAIDLNGDGIQTLNIDKGVKFDLLNTGNAINVGWISSADALLAVDNNGNGTIDNRAELFGGGVGEGFAKLASFDSNRDGFVTANDANFGQLKVWQDKNSDAVTNPNELFSLSDVGIVSLKVAHTSTFTLDAQANVLGESSSVTTNTGKTLDMVDVYFQVATNTPNLLSTQG